MKRGRLIFSMILCVVYIFLVGWAGGVVGGIASLATGPHRFFMLLALIFNIVAVGIGFGWPCTTAVVIVYYCYISRLLPELDVDNTDYLHGMLWDCDQQDT